MILNKARLVAKGFTQKECIDKKCNVTSIKKICLRKVEYGSLQCVVGLVAAENGQLSV